MYLHLQKHGPFTCKSMDADDDACADGETDWCSYFLYNPSFCNYADVDVDTDADQSILAISQSTYVAL